MARSAAAIVERLELYYEAERKVLRGQSYTLGNRQLTRANLSEIRKAIKDLENELEQLEGRSRGFSRRVVFFD
nr:MAG TPA: head to tail adaptor [Caudoviricetes sp.]